VSYIALHHDRPNQTGPAVQFANDRAPSQQRRIVGLKLAALELSPHPTRRSSVVAFTMMPVTPSRFTSELTSRCVYGTLVGLNPKLAIFVCGCAIIFRKRRAGGVL
jgi:hypothetical protein